MPLERDNFANSDIYHLSAPLFFFQNPTAEMKPMDELIKITLQQTNFSNVRLARIKKGSISSYINLNSYSPVGFPRNYS